MSKHENSILREGIKNALKYFDASQHARIGNAANNMAEVLRVCLTKADRIAAAEVVAPEPMKSITRYLIRRRAPKKRPHVAHLWDGRDTLCRLASTGGLNKKRYDVHTSTHGLGMCALCMKEHRELERKHRQNT